jgi:hypothetical protein
MAKHFIDHIQQPKVYVSSGVGPEQQEETEVQFKSKKHTE